VICCRSFRGTITCAKRTKRDEKLISMLHNNILLLLSFLLYFVILFFLTLITIICRSTYPVQYGGPPFHSDALENGEHGQSDIIERRDPVVGTYPALYARGRRVVTEVRVVRLRFRVRVRVARRRARALDIHRNQIIQPNTSTQKHYYNDSAAKTVQ